MTRNYPIVSAGLFRYYVVEIRHPKKTEYGALHHCGYVAFPEECRQYVNREEIDVHGGVTLDVVENGLAILGFDCAHSGDSRTPGDENFRDYFFCEEECRSMIRQIAAQLCPPIEASPSLFAKR